LQRKINFKKSVFKNLKFEEREREREILFKKRIIIMINNNNNNNNTSVLSSCPLV